jgi:integrase
MISWGYRAELIDQVPRALEREWTVPIAIGEVKPAGVSEIQDLLKVASPRERLYILLGLNLGYGPRDISALRHDEIDWASGLVTRQRTKTKRFQNSPTISYQLWPEVLQLLKEFRSNHETLALTTIHGAPLVQDKHRVDGSLIRSDAIHSAWVRLCRKVEKPIQLKQLRKTSASLLANHPTHSRWVDHFLGHVPKSMAAKHYVKLDETPFHEALRWLRSQYLGE